MGHPVESKPVLKATSHFYRSDQNSTRTESAHPNIKRSL